LKLYLLSGVLALGGFAAASSGGLVLVTTMLSFGLLIPVWIAVANLFWVWVLALPVVIGARTDRPLAGMVVGGLASTLAYGGTVMWMQAGVQREMAAFTQPAVIAEGQPLRSEPARSAEIITDDASQLVDGPCNALCKGLLQGAADWLRVSDISDPRKPQTWAFQRGEQADCIAEDADFPRDAVCILAMPVPDAPADLTIFFAREPSDMRMAQGFAGGCDQSCRLGGGDGAGSTVLYKRGDNRRSAATLLWAG
jgi:hypothetical protein